MPFDLSLICSSKSQGRFYGFSFTQQAIFDDGDTNCATWVPYKETALLGMILCKNGKANAIISMMSDIYSDTHPEIAVLQRNLLRQIGPARKLAMLGQMNQTVRTLAISGLQSRYPQDSSNMLRRRLADLVLGPVLAALVYGPLIE